MIRLVFKFQHMAYEKHITWRETDKIMTQKHFAENKTEILQHGLNMW